MRFGDFDSLTRALAATTSRREAVRILAGAAASAVLAYIGASCNSDDGGPAAPKDQCATPSTCGARAYCNPEETCLCIKSAEGYNRCGAIPTTCQVQLCQTSADCANLGENFFCDTPNSGCCTDPPADLPRCIAPCGDVDNNPGTVCDGDPVSSESIKAAAAAIAGGATEVDLSPGGCFHYRRTVVNGFTVAETITADGKRVAGWDHSATASNGTRDSDLDGFNEWLVLITRDAAGETQKVTVTEYDPVTRTPSRRRTQTITGANEMHVVVEAAPEGGALAKVAEYDAARLQEVGLDPWDAALVVRPARTPAVTPAVAQGTPGPCGIVPDASCPPGLLDAARLALEQATADGSECLAAHGLAAEAASMAVNYYLVDIVCASSLPAESGPAAVCAPDVSNPNERFPIYINPSSFPSDPAAQRSVLFHEMLHTVLTEDHDPALNATTPEIRRENDRVRACNSLCMNPHATKCDCATCLQKSKCEPPCDKYEGCATKNEFGICPCPARFQAYPTFTECTVECPSGLACFGFQCRKVTNPCMG